MLATVTLAPGGIIGWIVVGLIAGWLASSVMGSGYGILGDLIMGLVGAFIGGLIVGAFTTGTMGIVGSIVVAFVGAVVVIGVSRLLTRGRTSARV
ncbi:MAG TPA: GlsB/YeaQ/YmgE family stress response membrane protein [Gemmatimonadaceae bacterium]